MLQTKVIKQDEGVLHMVYGEVYAPNRPDAQGEFMTAETIRKMAHKFVKDRKFSQIDVMHDNQVVKCEILESWIAPENDTNFLPGSWCVGVHVPVTELWNKYQSGELNGFSLEAMVTKVEREVEVEIDDVITGKTTKSEEHVHTFTVKYDDSMHFLGGETDYVQGHSHKILAGTHTQLAAGHTHRFSSVDNIQILPG